MKKLNPVNYEKGAWILHMLRGMLGEASFFRGIRHYYNTFAGGNALSEDFQKAMESTGGISLSTFFRQWLYQPGWPEYSISWHWDEAAGEVEFSVRQMQTTGLFDMALDIAFSLQNRREIHKLRVTDAEHRFRIPLQTKPLSVEIDPGGWVLKSVSVTSY
jgi:aminopeptidase N